jgi:hypothetical protein
MKSLKVTLSLLVAAVLTFAFFSAMQNNALACYWRSYPTCGTPTCPTQGGCGLPTPNTLVGGYYEDTTTSGPNPGFQGSSPLPVSCNCIYQFWNGQSYQTQICPSTLTIQSHRVIGNQDCDP